MPQVLGLSVPTDAGYLALLAVLVIVPTTAICAAVLDRMMARRRDGTHRASQSPHNAFPVVGFGGNRAEDDPAGARNGHIPR